MNPAPLLDRRHDVAPPTASSSRSGVSPRPASTPLLRRVLTFGAYLAAGCALARLLLTADLRSVGAMIAAAGPVAVLAIAPVALQVALEAGSWRLVLRRLGRIVPFHVAYGINLRADAVRLSFPAGSPLADGLRSVLFARERAVTMGDAAATLAVRKLAHMAGQGTFLVLGGSLGASLFARWAGPFGPLARVAPILCCVAGVGLIVAATTLALALFRGSVASRLERLLGRMTRGRASAAIAGRRAACASIDATLETVSRERRCLLWNVLTALGGYMLDASETLLMLWLLGFHLRPGEAIALEGVISVVRSLAFAVPGGIGIQDLSYHAMLLGTVGDAPAMGLVLLKRARDVLWVVTGWVGPAILRRLSSAPVVEAMNHVLASPAPAAVSVVSAPAAVADGALAP